MADGGTVAAIILVLAAALFVVYALYLSVQVVREKENVIIERFGEFKAVVRPPCTGVCACRLYMTQTMHLCLAS